MPLMDLRARLDAIRPSGRPMIGAFVSSTDPATTTILGSVGFDYVIIDGEHGPLHIGDVLNHVRAAQAAGIIPMARVLHAEPALIQSFLDVGVQMVKVPHVDTAEQARAAAEMVRYGPGGRGMCPVCHAASYSMEAWQDHVRHSNANVFVSPSLESRQALANIDAILAIDGIDIVGFSPGDLSQDLGIDLTGDRRRLYELWADARDRIHAAGKLAIVPGGFGFEGADLITHGMDLLFMRTQAMDVIAAYREGRMS